MNGVQIRKVAGILILPRIIPRAKKLFASGFGYIAFLMAHIYGAVRLLPREHPYLNPANIGKFGVRHVIGEAANRLVLKRKNADQIFIFAALLAGVVILVLQFVLIIYAFIFKPAMAASIFLTPDPVASVASTDMAFIVLDQVFGIPNMFCTQGNICTAVNAALPWPFHVAFHELLRFYSLGLLLVGVVIFLYYVVVVVGETATTGHPFGQRFQNVWTPIRLVVALGLLVPINYGLNSAQYIVLYSAKFGSGIATNAWLQYNATMRTAGIFPGGSATNPLGERSSLLAKPTPPSVMSVVQMMTIVHACVHAYWKTDTTRDNAGNPAWPPTGNGVAPANFNIRPYLVKLPHPSIPDGNDRLELLQTTSYIAALDFFGNSPMVIRFGRYDPSSTQFDKEKGRVKPLCGDVRVPASYFKTRGLGAGQGGPDAMQEFYFNLIKNMWHDPDGNLIKDLPRRAMELAIHVNVPNQCQIGCGHPSLPSCPNDCRSTTPGAAARQELIDDYGAQLNVAVRDAWNIYNTNATDIEISQAVLDRGWGGAGIWYNVIAEINGAFIDSVLHQPMFERYPLVMEQVREDKTKHDSHPSPLDQFDPNIAGQKPVETEEPMEIAQALNGFYQWWNKGIADATKSDNNVSGGVVEDTIKSILGLNGLFAMRGDNAHIHPLAQLTAAGKSLVDSAIINIGTSTLTGALGGLLKLADPSGGSEAIAELASGLTMTIAFLALTAGVVLYYVLPFLPFLYFFFAFGTWIKSIFEAMVGAPLWALAHLKLDGEGLPGDSASSGYFLIFEIFVRPILTVFGLVASILILSAQVRVLNVIWTLVTSNLTGYDTFTAVTVPAAGVVLPKNSVDQFFYTIVYAMIVYMMATASFKMIDKIPDGILRFMGAGVSAFSDINPDPTEGLTRYVAIGGITMGQQVTGGIRGLGQAGGHALGDALGEIAKKVRGT